MICAYCKPSGRVFEPSTLGGSAVALRRYALPLWNSTLVSTRPQPARCDGEPETHETDGPARSMCSCVGFFRKAETVSFSELRSCNRGARYSCVHEFRLQVNVPRLGPPSQSRAHIHTGTHASEAPRHPRARPRNEDRKARRSLASHPSPARRTSQESQSQPHAWQIALPRPSTHGCTSWLPVRSSLSPYA